MSDYKPDMRLQEAFEDWRDSSVKSAETIRLLRLSLERYEEFLGRPGRLADFTEQNVVAFMRHRQEVLHRAKATVEREGNKLLTLWRWATKRGWAPLPLLSIKKAAPPIPSAWNRQEIQAIFAAAESYDKELKSHRMGKPGFIPGNLVMAVLIRLLFDTGERINATLQLSWDCIDMEHRFVTIRSCTRKGDAQDNQARFGRKTRRALLALRAYYDAQGIWAADGRVFPENHRSAYYQHLKNILKNAGIPPKKRQAFHQLRRSHATALYLAGGDPTNSLGHTTQQMTRDYYLDPRYVRQEYAADILSGNPFGAIKRLWRRTKAAVGLW